MKKNKEYFNKPKNKNLSLYFFFVFNNKFR